MKTLEDSGTRRQLFKALAAGAASISVLAVGSKSGRAMGTVPNPGRGHGCCCLLKGARISTPSGDRPIEDLQIGDDVDTLSGSRTIKWIGYRKFTKDDDRPWPRSVTPVRVARSAIDDNTPHRDLYLSPEHCLFINEVLIPVKHLVNDVSIAPALPSGVMAIEYYHVEFESHEVIRAEGAPVESFRDASQREFFSNFVQHERLYGRDDREEITPFAPVLCYRNRRERVTGLARSVISHVIDVRDAIQIAHDQLARRAEAMLV